MAKAVTTGSSGGVGVSGLLGVAFVVLKLTGYITWSWTWVLAPFWIPFAVVGVVLLMAGVMLMVAKLLERW